MTDMNDKAYPERQSLEVVPEQRVALCRCWRSKTFPLCDGSHRALNEEQTHPVGPIIVTGVLDAEGDDS